MKGKHFERIRTSGGMPRCSFKKGDRVCWRGKDENGNVELKHGTVTRGGDKVHAMMDGGEFEVKGGRNAFQFSDKPLPKDLPSSMDDYVVKGYKAIPELSDETIAYTATIMFKGKPVLSAKNGGYGGDTEVHPYSYDDASCRGMVQKFFNDTREWSMQFGQTKPFEAYDEWIDWYVNHRPYGVTAAKYNEGIEKRMAEIRG